MDLDTLLKVVQIGGVAISLIGMLLVLRPIPPFRYWDPLFGNSMYKVHKETGISFNDIIGYSDVKARLIDHAIKLKQDLVTPSKGYYFIGSNGVGKTMMAKAIANEIDIPFIEILGEHIEKNDIGPLIDKIKRKYPKCVVFFDESEKNNWFNSSSILKYLDGFSKIDGIIFIVANNESGENDSSLTRSGRIDNIIQFGLPNEEHRLEHIQKLFPNLSDQEQDDLSVETAGFVQADIARLKRECEFRNNYQISTIRSIIKGIREKTTNIIQPLIASEYLERIAYHEIGHLIVAEALKDAKNFRIVTIQEGKDFAGLGSSLTIDGVLTEPEILARIAVMLASSLAENKFCGSRSSLSAHDFASIRKLLNIMIDNSMICPNKIGMNSSIIGSHFSDPDYNDEISRINKVLSGIIHEILANNIETIEIIKNELIRKKTLYRDDLDRLFPKDLTNSINISNYFEFQIE